MRDELKKIAKKFLLLDLPENIESPQMHKCYLWQISHALEAAYIAGSLDGTKKSTEDFYATLKKNQGC